LGLSGGGPAGPQPEPIGSITHLLLDHAQQRDEAAR